MTALLHGLRGDHVRHDVWRHRTTEVAGPHHAHRVGRSYLSTFIDIRLAVRQRDLAAADRLTGHAFTELPGARLHVYTRAIAAELAVLGVPPSPPARPVRGPVAWSRTSS